MSISTDYIHDPSSFGQRLTRLADGNYILRRNPGSFFGEDRLMPANQVRPELKALFEIGETDVIGTDIVGVWHPCRPTEGYKNLRRTADVARLEAEARAARAELERDQAREREAVIRARREALTDPAAVVLGELLGGFIVGATRRRR
jgi:hypothetical protein